MICEVGNCKSCSHLSDTLLCRWQTLYAIGSCSKAFLSAAIGILIDDFAQGRNVTALPDGLNEFTFDTKLQALFPGGDVWALEDEWATKKANIRDILSHVSGLTRCVRDHSLYDTPLMPIHAETNSHTHEAIPH